MTDLAIITGMSGAGRTEAMHTFEDLGYFCIDNLPPSLLSTLVESKDIPDDEDGVRKLAVVCDSRNVGGFSELKVVLGKIQEKGIAYRILFLDATDDELLARFKASRRRHPLCANRHITIAQAIEEERAMLKEMRESAHFIIDTSDKKPVETRREIQKLFSGRMPQQGMSVVVYSFGFKHGMPADADIVIDVRFLPNPYYDPSMRHLTGLDEKVNSFVMGRPETQEFLKRWKDLLLCVMPGYVTEGKQQLAIAIGCTGGQHRSVAIADATGRFLQEQGYFSYTTHRDLSRAETKCKDA